MSLDNVWPGSLAVAEPTTDFTTLADAPSLFQAHFSERSNNSALLLGFEHEYFKEQHQRAVVSVVELSGLVDEPPLNGEAGAGGDANSGGNGSGGSELFAGGPGEGGARTTPSDTVSGSGGTAVSHAGTGGRGGLDSGLGEAGSTPDEGDDVEPPSDGGAAEAGAVNGLHTSKGCGCRAAGRSQSGGEGSALPLLLAAFVARRRRAATAGGSRRADLGARRRWRQ